MDVRILITVYVTAIVLHVQANTLRYRSGDDEDEMKGRAFLAQYNVEAPEMCRRTALANWEYNTNITEYNKNRMLEQNLLAASYAKEAWENSTSFAWIFFQDAWMIRQFKKLSVLGKAALEEKDIREVDGLIADMKSTYSTATICPYESSTGSDSSAENTTECKLALEPELKAILKKSRNWDELLHVWKSYRDQTGKKMKNSYPRYIELYNRAAVLNGFNDTGVMWREPYESETMLQDLEDLWKQMLPLYQQIHAYVRRKLIEKYGENKIRSDGPIPAHVLGSMWAQSWDNIEDITAPFPGKISVDVTDKMIEKNMTVEEIFRLSEEFFTSLGLEPMSSSFWEKSMIRKPKDREAVCHASAWDFCDGKDFRIKQCTEITMRDLIVTHHEMGHIQYYHQYAHQPHAFRRGANPGFHEAIGDVLALSVSTPQHLKKVGLLDDVVDDNEGDLNYLMRVASQKIVFMPSAYLIDLWRWQLFSGKTKAEDMNREWWNLRLKYQGLCPPVLRSEEDFDAGAKYHVPANVPYIRYFVSTVVQFQFYKELCEEAGHQGPLYKCDIYQSKEAGKLFKEMMQLGSSLPWPEAMRIITKGKTDRMSAEAILSYFQPLSDWLEEQNRNETLGWKSSDSFVCP